MQAIRIPHMRSRKTGFLSSSLPGRTALAVSLLVLPAAAFAQDASADSSGDIVVTAQKRSENARDVPLSISVLGADQLAKEHITDYGDLARHVPGLSFTNSGGPGLSRIALRGIASSSGSATVGTYLDDVALSFPNQFFTGATMPRLFDIDHVEVLRGPQGTLYGDSSLGGTIRFITAQPKLGSVNGFASGQVSGTDNGGTNYEGSAAINLPIGDTAALRVSGVAGRESGFIDHVDANGNVDRKNVDSNQYYAVRGSLLFQPTDTLSITPAVQWQYTKSNDTSIVNLALPRYERDNIVPEPSKDWLFVPSLTISARLGENTLTSVTSYMMRKFARQFDATIYDSEYVAGVIDPTYGATYDRIAALPGVFTNTDRVSSWSEELRFASPSIRESGRRFEWQVGAYFNTLKAKSLDDEYVQGLNGAVNDIVGSSVESIIGYAAPNDLLGYFHSNRTFKQIAGFAEASVMILPKLKATAGVRQVKAWTDFTMDEGGWLADSTPAHEHVKSSEAPTTPKFALNYEVNRDASVYASATKGFRLGGQNNSLPSYCARAITTLGLTADGAKSYGSDSIWSYEVGAKASLFGNRLRVNASLYAIDWSNIQQQLRLSSCGYVITANAGDAVSRGGELEVNARITRELTFNVTGGITDAHITRAAAGSSAKVGQKVLGVPDKTLTLALDYDKALSDRLGLHATLDWNYTGKSHGTFSVADDDYNRSPYWVGNLNVGVDVKDLSLSVFVKNLANDHTIIQQPSVLFIQQGLYVRPRTIGASISKHF
ncbi:TonB-dependent receptor [soil metagenome]